MTRSSYVKVLGRALHLGEVSEPDLRLALRMRRCMDVRKLRQVGVRTFAMAQEIAGTFACGCSATEQGAGPHVSDWRPG